MMPIRRGRRLAALVFVAGMMLSATVSADVEPENAPDPQHMRTKIQWVAIRGGGGFGITASVHLFTLRWDYVYWDIARAALTAVPPGGVGIMEGGQGGDGLLWGGTGIGFPWHLDDLGRHEIRLGVVGGVGMGSGNAYFFGERYDDEGVDGEDYKRPLVPWVVFGPEIYYVWHFEEHFAFLTGVEFQYGPPIGDADGGFFLSGFVGAAI